MAKPIEERGPVDPDTFARDIAGGFKPVVLRGQVAAWPAVLAAHAGARAMRDYLTAVSSGDQPLEVMIGAPEIAGRFFYDAALQGFNFARGQVTLNVLLDELLRLIDEPQPHTLYAGAAATADHLPGFAADNPLPMVPPGATPRIWIGNRSRVAPHFDVSDNLACVVAGRRRFTLFPPDQISNLYVGPLEWTLAGQPVSMVDIAAPDLVRFPRYQAAAAAALEAELGPGDAIFIPTLWWHAVDACAPFNVLLNYWWSDAAQAAPFPALIHAMLAIRDVPAAELQAWRGWFDHYVFGPDAKHAADHLPAAARGALGAPSPARTSMIRDYLRRVLDR